MSASRPLPTISRVGQNHPGQLPTAATRSAAARLLRRVWIPLVIAVVLATSGLIVLRLHRLFAAADLNAEANAGIEIVQFNPKVVVYEVYGRPGSSATIGYLDADANLHNLSGVALPWSTTISTTLPAVSASIMVQADGDQIGCRITVDGTVRDERSADGVKAQTYCLVKSA